MNHPRVGSYHSSPGPASLRPGLGCSGDEGIGTANDYSLALRTRASAEEGEQAVAVGPCARENRSFLVTLAENLVGAYRFSFAAA